MSIHSAPTIERLLADSLIQAVMRADGVDPGALKAMLTGVGARVAAGRQEPKIALEGARVRLSAETRPRQQAPTLLLAPPAGGAIQQACYCC